MKKEIKLLDGSLSYPLEKQGYDLNNNLWTGDALINNPDFMYVHIFVKHMLAMLYQIYIAFIFMFFMRVFTSTRAGGQDDGS